MTGGQAKVKPLFGSREAADGSKPNLSEEVPVADLLFVMQLRVLVNPRVSSYPVARMPSAVVRRHQQAAPRCGADEASYTACVCYKCIILDRFNDCWLRIMQRLMAGSTCS